MLHTWGRLLLKSMRNYIAELTGTFALVFCGTGAIIIDRQSGGAVTHVGVAITFGLIVTAMIYSLGNISGAHLNPAVSIAFTAAKLFPAKRLPFYIAAQLSGAVFASIILRFLFPGSELLGATMPAGTELQSFMLELILTFLLMLVILSVSAGSKEQGIHAGLVIGGMVMLEAIFAGPICGASMNPARSFAPALVSQHCEHLWIYIIAPTAGAIMSIPVWKYLHVSNSTLTG
jgi:aquaporin NIP